MEFKEFLASDESESDEDDDDDATEDKPKKKHQKQDKYRVLLQSGEDSDSDNEDGQDMEVTFNTGLEDISKHALEKKDKKSETVWEAQLRKRREKKMARKNSSKYSTDDESSDSDREPKEEVDDFFVEEPSIKAGKEGKGKKDKRGKKNEETAEAEAASIAELELLLADGNTADTGLKGYNLKPKKVESNGKKGRKEKRKREKVIPDEGKLPNVDYDDPRFSAIFTSPLFALDPTDPQFKRYVVTSSDVALEFSLLAEHSLNFSELVTNNGGQFLLVSIKTANVFLSLETEMLYLWDCKISVFPLTNDETYCLIEILQNSAKYTETCFDSYKNYYSTVTH